MKEIKLSQGKVALVDDDDFDRLNQFKWCASQESKWGKKWYAIRRITVDGKRRKVRMHREVLGLPVIYDGVLVGDHVNHDGLDNRRSNLQIITQAENIRRSPNWRTKKEAPSL